MDLTLSSWGQEQVPSDKIDIDEQLVRSARRAAAGITGRIQEFIEKHSTTSCERTVCRLLGIDGVDSGDIPLPNRVVEELEEVGVLERGAAYWVAGGTLANDCTPQKLAERVTRGELSGSKLVQQVEALDPAEVRRQGARLTETALDQLAEIRDRRFERREQLGVARTPLVYVIVATGNIYEDVVQAKAAARQGADIVAVIRSTAQSLLDYVPYGATTEGFGGTYATQKNFELMRTALNEVSEEIGRYVHLVNYASGLCMPEIAAMAALEGLDILLSDAMYGVLFRDINPERTFVDQFFSRIVSTFAGIAINTGEDNYLTTADAVKSIHTAVASQFINEAFAHHTGMPSELMGLGHAFEKDPELEDGFLLELADAQLVRQLFPEAPLKFMPPTKYMTGNIFKTHLVDAMFNLASVITGQTIHLCGILTEAIHTPHLQDRMLSIQNFRYISDNARHLGAELEFKPGGIIEERANFVLNRAVELLRDVEQKGLWEAIEEGIFADVQRPRSGGKGAEGMLKRAPDYYNPFMTRMLAENRAMFQEGDNNG